MPNARQPLYLRFTDAATRIVHYAQEEAIRRRETVVGSEHLLAGMVQEHKGKAASALARLGITVKRVRAEITLQRHPVQTKMVTAESLQFKRQRKKIT